MAAAVKNCAIIKKEGNTILYQVICPKCGKVFPGGYEGFIYEGKTYIRQFTCQNPSCPARFEVQFIG